jgi:hypothetical protein
MNTTEDVHWKATLAIILLTVTVTIAHVWGDAAGHPALI